MSYMSLSVCVVPVAPLKAEPTHKSEIISQLLFGEFCEVLEVAKDFTKIKALYDGYEGWCQTPQLLPTQITDRATDKTDLTTQWSTEILFKGQPMLIPFGSSISFTHLLANKDIDVAKLSEHTWQPGKEQITESLIKRFAYTYINTPYLGGKSVFGVDCSGFTQIVFKLLGIALLRDAYQQATQGEAIGFIQEARCGDLAFFDNADGRIVHVGIMLSADTIIHSSGKVRVDTIDHSGIISVDTGLRTHNLRIIKRYF